ncbi:hypothetical protein EXIGLDRAFT_832743 [Exidia glandulosa HHB12029]|uniref:F-box domain-containing protein n=1 Tax=Exidia glandulosa HHB12029 TaxID=1314781 RepID=A0A165LAT6_EXIGL|nr:hypothetical protein EXIGLDRAFT_832743 [Exidia glandulosa HHB12029]
MLLPPEIDELRTLVTSLTRRVAERYAAGSSHDDDDSIVTATAAVLAVVHEATSKLLCERNARITINCLPTEILGRILREMQLDAGRTQVLVAPTRASLVCRRWRAVALATPCLWSTLEHIKGRGICPVPVFKSLLQRSEAMSVLLPQYLSPEHIDAVSAQMHRISRLQLPAEYWDDAPSSPTQRRAPQLQFLAISGIARDCPPRAMFEGYAPMLQTLVAGAEFLSPSSVYPALAGLTTARIWAKDGRHFFELCTSLFAQCKGLTTFIGHVPSHDYALPQQPIVHNLQSLRLAGFLNDYLPLLKVLDHGRIRSISLFLEKRNLPPPDLSAVLTPLRSPITHLGIHCRGVSNDLLYIELSDSRGFVRTIEGIWATTISSFLSQHAHLAWSLESLTVFGTFDSLPALGIPLDQLKMLSIGIGIEYSHKLPHSMRLGDCQTLPVLRLTTTERYSFAVAAAKIVSVIRGVTTTEGDPVRISELCLNGITLPRYMDHDSSTHEGSMSALTASVDTIKFTDTPWKTLAIPILYM